MTTAQGARFLNVSINARRSVFRRKGNLSIRAEADDVKNLLATVDANGRKGDR